jgi:hypothetical protein
MSMLLKVKKGIGMKLDADDNPTFNEWLARVDKFLVRAIGLTHDDLADCNYADWFDARIRPIRAANKALKANGAMEY